MLHSSVSVPRKPRSSYQNPAVNLGQAKQNTYDTQAMDPQMRLQLEVAYEALENGRSYLFQAGQ